jgi:sterol desaturase/sphingolipid hydroxylase (fatty acid hydroxylase superfamily)
MKDNFLAMFQFAQQWMGFVPLLLVAVALCWPLERILPRVTPKNAPARRTMVIAGITLAGLIVTQAYAWWAQQSVIETFVKLKFFSLAKLPIPDWLLILVSFLALDLFYFLSHFIAHHVQPLWRLHKIHHADEHVTAFSALLHHPLESIYAAAFVAGLAVMLGMPVLVYVYFGLAIAIHAVFAHANVVLPESLDRKLRLLIVTPDVHRTHHSQNMTEGNSNFGAMFTIWDRLFGTYVDQPKEPVNALSMGLPRNSRPAEFSMRELLLLPFRSEKSS